MNEHLPGNTDINAYGIPAFNEPRITGEKEKTDPEPSNQPTKNDQ